MPRPKHYDIVIIGGGVQGLSLAYNLALRETGKIAVFDKSYIGSGASGRNGEMIRSAFGSEEWIRLFDTSLRLWETLSAELDFNVMFTRCGYLVLASTPEDLAAYRTNCKRQNAMGLKTRMLNAGEVAELIPSLNPQATVGGVFQKEGGVARHDAVVWAYARAARRLGVEIFPYTEIVAVNVDTAKITGVRTIRENVLTGIVVNAAGAFAGQVAEMAGVKLLLDVYRLEMIVTEPLKPFLQVALSSPHFLAYMHQTARGEFAGGAEPQNLSPYLGLKNTRHAVQDMARKFGSLFPGLRGAKLMRQWAGIVAKSPDRGPLLGAVDGLEGFFLNAGWGGYGFMGSPAGGRLMAELITDGQVPDALYPFNPDRFATGQAIVEPTIIGAAEDKG
ncbi:MAG: FAD-dependent oxidoreductase [Deltaproteobacteria bacterium]|nr:FAD-dependent oxidoreductase [Deltaproteobacteria bacterium]